MSVYSLIGSRTWAFRSVPKHSIHFGVEWPWTTWPSLRAIILRRMATFGGKLRRNNCSCHAVHAVSEKNVTE